MQNKINRWNHKRNITITIKGGKKMEEKVTKINENRIVLTNFDILSLINPTPVKEAFDKIQKVSCVSGKLQYWVYKLWKKIAVLYKDLEEIRIKLAKEFCDKEDDGSLKFVDSQYQFDPGQKELYDAEIQNQVHISYPNEVEKQKDTEQIILKYCKRDKNNNPIKIGGNNLAFSDDGIKNFNSAYSEMLSIENVLPIDKIKIDSILLEKMNAKEENIIDIKVMIELEKFFEFVE